MFGKLQNLCLDFASHLQNSLVFILRMPKGPGWFELHTRKPDIAKVDLMSIAVTGPPICPGTQTCFVFGMIVEVQAISLLKLLKLKRDMMEFTTRKNETENKETFSSEEKNIEQPLMFFEFGRHYYGGSYVSSVKLINGVKDHTPVVVADANGIPSQYLDNLEKMGIDLKIVDLKVDPITVGGSSLVSRLWRVARSGPEVLSFINKLRKTINEVQPRAIWTNSEKALFMLMAATRTQYVLQSAGNFLKFKKTSGNTSDKSQLKVPIAVFVRGELKNIRPYCSWAWKRVDMALGNSTQGLLGLKKSKYTPKKTKVVYTGMDIETLTKASKKLDQPLPGSPTSLKLVFPGSLIQRKNHEIALRGLSQFLKSGGDAVMWLCGGEIPAQPDYLPGVKRLIAELNLENNVFFLGWREDMPGIIRRADIVTLTSKSEGMPRALMEGMALSRPILATKASGVEELVRHGTDGYLIDLDDVEGYAKGLKILSDKNLRKKMGASASERIATEFTPENFVQGFLDGMNTISKGQVSPMSERVLH